MCIVPFYTKNPVAYKELIVLYETITIPQEVLFRNYSRVRHCWISKYIFSSLLVYDIPVWFISLRLCILWVSTQSKLTPIVMFCLIKFVRLIILKKSRGMISIRTICRTWIFFSVSLSTISTDIYLLQIRIAISLK